MYSRYIKRLIDILSAFVSMPFFGALVVIVAILIKMDDKGPIFYNVDRMGKKGEPFKMYKFRTMKVDAPDIRNDDGSTFNKKSDPRLTRVGKFFRATSLDEIPQVINVFRGQMSFVGPRPDLVDQKILYRNCMDKWEKRVSVRPGITGYSQAYSRNLVGFDDRLEQDLYYVREISFLLDVKILFKTFVSVVGRHGVYKNK